ncbi:MAG: hypothetical protein JWL65_3576 [Gammaproteobacteria bacterium]|nr:hypothetical protein [Gammaproteobacteria bacterium]
MPRLNSCIIANARFEQHVFWRRWSAWSRTVLEASFTASLDPLRLIPVTRLFIRRLLPCSPGNTGCFWTGFFGGSFEPALAAC